MMLGTRRGAVRRVIVVAGVRAVGLGAAPFPKERDGRDAFGEIQGNWTMVRWSRTTRTSTESITVAPNVFSVSGWRLTIRDGEWLDLHPVPNSRRWLVDLTERGSARAMP